MKKQVSTNVIYLVGAFGGFLFGYDIGIINGALPGLKADWHISPFMEGMITSILFVGAMIGAPLMGDLAEKFGRKKMIMISAFFFILGSVGSGFASSIAMMLVSRVLLGFAVGAASALVPMYLSEIAPAKARGTISGLNQLMITIGIVVAYGVNYLFAHTVEGWRYMLAGAAVPAILLILGSILLPESPRFLATHGKKDEALKVLKGLRTEEQAFKEYQAILTSEETFQGKSTQKLSKTVMMTVVIGCLLAFLQQIQGANTIFYYSSQIFARVFGNGLGGLISTIGIGFVNVAATLLILLIVDRFDRKSMLMMGSVAMGVCLFFTGVFFPMVEKGNQLATWGIFLMICLYVVAYACSWAALTWIVIGEMFPSSVRGLATGIASSVNWLGNIVVAFFFPILMDSIGLSKIFFLFAAMCIFGFLFAKYMLYETKGKSLEEIDQEIEAKEKAAIM